MKVICWGCRGSLPTPGACTVKYGGNTTCFQVNGSDGSLIIIDAGSGIRALGNHLLKKDRRREITLLITHAHWDHLIGFPFFTPAYFSRYSIKVRGCNGTPYSLKEIISHQFISPYFPVKFRHLQADMSFSQNAKTSFQVGSIHVESIKLNHPGGGVGYKFTEKKRSFVFLTDNELEYHHREGLKPDDYISFAKGADLLIHDAQYTTSEYKKTNRSWGHSTFEQAFRLGRKARVKRLGFCHHDQERTDAELGAIGKRYTRKSKSMQCFVVKEKSTHLI
jgi:phosphoribosyl 1,2-cyclic phosphodiesterase